MTSWWEIQKQSRAIKKFNKLFKNLPTTEAKRALCIRLFAASSEIMSKTSQGLVFIEPWDLFADQDGNLYYFRDGTHVSFAPIYSGGDEDDLEERVKKIWPTFLP